MPGKKQSTPAPLLRQTDLLALPQKHFKAPYIHIITTALKGMLKKVGGFTHLALGPKTTPEQNRALFAAVFDITTVTIAASNKRFYQD